MIKLKLNLRSWKMPEYIFYTSEGYTQAPDGEDIENCQLLGRAYGKDKSEALNNLLKDNPWIVERGYNPHETIIKKIDASLSR